jgi:hypothetical protein
MKSAMQSSALVAVSAVAIMGAAYADWIPVPTVRVDLRRPFEARFESSPLLGSGREFVLVYIGSSTCPWSNNPTLAPVVDSLRAMLLARAADTLGFATMGLTQDAKVHAGIEHLMNMGPFDEVSTGRGWMNSAALRYLLLHSGTLATPQVLVLERTLRQNDPFGHFEVVEEIVRIRRVGLGQIVAWAEAGAPLPRFLAPVEPPVDAATPE